MKTPRFWGLDCLIVSGSGENALKAINMSPIINGQKILFY